MSAASPPAATAAGMAARPFVIVDDRAPSRSDADSDGGRLIFCPSATNIDHASAMNLGPASAAPGITFQRFVRASSAAALVAFFRAIIAEVEQPPRAIRDYHLRIVRRGCEASHHWQARAR